MAGLLDEISAYFSPDAVQARRAAINARLAGGPNPGYAQNYQDSFLAQNRNQEPLSVSTMRGAQEFLPGVGDVLALGEAGDAYSRGDYTAAGLLGAAGLIGLVPGAGDAIARPIAAAGRGAADLAGRIEIDPNTFGTMGGNIRIRPSENIPRQITENNVLSAVDRLSAEELAAAQPFTRTSGFAAPRVGGGRSRDPALFSDFSSKKQTGVPPSEWTVSGRSLPTSVQPPRDMTAEQFQREGFTDLTGFVADSTLGNTVIDEINGLRLPSPVMQQAGHAFGDNINDLGFMSEAGALTSKTNAWGRMMDDGGRVAVTPMTMGTSGGDFSQHQAMNLVQAIRAAESQIDPNFVPLIGAAKNNNRLLPEGMGLLSPELPEYLTSLKGGQRAAFVKALDTSPALAAGVPSVGAVRWATMDPNLINQPTLSSGYRVFEPDLTDRELRDFFVYPENHGSYDAAIKRAGENMTMGAPRPWTIQFPDEAYGKIMDSTPSGANMPMVNAMPKDLKSFQMNPNLSQTIDDQWVDSNMMYDEILRQRGREQADLYAIDAMMNRATLAGR
jgi:hypothetical protein